MTATELNVTQLICSLVTVIGALAEVGGFLQRMETDNKRKIALCYVAMILGFPFLIVGGMGLTVLQYRGGHLMDVPTFINAIFYPDQTTMLIVVGCTVAFGLYLWCSRRIIRKICK